MNKSELKISIITVVYNNKRTIKDAINSVLNQTYSNIEYIIIDGNSTDGTMDIVLEFSGRISKVISEKDSGIYDAMNKGIDLATGDVIGILNSDDMYNSLDTLQYIMDLFISDNDLDILYGDLVYVKTNDINSIVRKWIGQEYYNNYFEYGNVPPHPSLFVRAHVYNQAGLFNLKYRLASDYEFMLRIFKKFDFKIKYLPILIVKMRLGGATNNSVFNILKGNNEILDAWRENGLSVPFLLMPLRLIKRVLQFF
jgi:glycosyltransferase involved in cell wall biosynthesis